jgi:tetratricopeptide (TPR) repeat protein
MRCSTASSPAEKLTTEQQGRIHLFIAESIDMAQRHRKIAVPANYAHIVEQTRQAVARGMQLDAKAHNRLGEAYEALHKPAEALDNYRRAMNLDTTHALRLQRKVIDLQLAQDDAGPAEMTLDEYLKDATLTDAERAWAYGQKAQILSDNGKFVDARALLDEAVKLATDPVAQGEVNYRLGYCAYKLNDAAEAERYCASAASCSKPSTRSTPTRLTCSAGSTRKKATPRPRRRSTRSSWSVTLTRRSPPWRGSAVARAGSCWGRMMPV